jgi:hypothetical protein
MTALAGGARSRAGARLPGTRRLANRARAAARRRRDPATLHAEIRALAQPPEHSGQTQMADIVISEFMDEAAIRARHSPGATCCTTRNSSMIPRDSRPRSATRAR